MTKHPTDEQLDFQESLADRAIAEIESGSGRYALHDLHFAVGPYQIKDLITALRAECADHESTLAELDAARNLIREHEWEINHLRSCKVCHQWLSGNGDKCAALYYRQADSAQAGADYEAARAAQEEE